jgi:ubiquinone/menaquinone biosynthesis C-methylase UbiE
VSVAKRPPGESLLHLIVIAAFTLVGLAVDALVRAIHNSWVSVAAEVVVIAAFMVLGLAAVFLLRRSVRRDRESKSLRKEVDGLKTLLDKLTWIEHFPDERSSYDFLRRTLPSASSVKLLGLANTSVFHLFPEYRDLLVHHKELSVLAINPEAIDLIQDFDGLASLTAAEDVLPDLQRQLELLPISREKKDEIARILGSSPPGREVAQMLEASISLWREVAIAAEKVSPDSAGYLDVRLYGIRPFFKGWIIDGSLLLKGGFRAPGIGLSEPLYLYEGTKGFEEIRNFSHMFKRYSIHPKTKSLLTNNGQQNCMIEPLVHNSYDKLSGSFYETSGTHCVAGLLERITGKTDQRILDVGCGTGNLALRIARQLDSSNEIIALDIDSELIGGLNRRLGAMRWPEESRASLRAIAGDILKLNMPERYFSMIICRHSLHHLFYLPAALDKLKKLLRDDGVMYVIEIEAPDDLRLNKFINEVAKLSNPQNQKYYTRQRLVELIEDAEFKSEILCASRDFKTPVKEYVRRCVSPEDFDRIRRLVRTLDLATKKAKERFSIVGTSEDDLVFILDELMIRATKA